mgnify:CR=1 FL=1
MLLPKEFDRITVDPQICMGHPTIRGLRYTVAFVLKLLASDMSKSEILQAYPELEMEDLNQTLKYAAWLANEEIRPLKVA